MKNRRIPDPTVMEQHQDFKRIAVGVRKLDDAIVNINARGKNAPRWADKQTVLDALNNGDVTSLRSISEYYFETSGIYNRLCKYLATIYKYDWYVSPTVTAIYDVTNQEKTTKQFFKVLEYLDNSNLKKMFGDISLKVIKYGCYYAYKIPSNEKIILQELPVSYCRSRFYQGTVPVVEFNLKYFDDKFPDAQYRKRILRAFPEEIQKAYALYKNNKLPPDYQGDDRGWYMLEPGMALKFNLNGSDFPVLANAIPSIISLDEAQELDRQKTMQQLLKILIQKLPLDKNYDLVFDVEEAADIHNNAVQMLKRAIGVDVLTTFADVDIMDMADDNTSTTTDDLERVERTVYNQTGISQNLFNTDSNLSLEKSILNDEASMLDLILQYQDFLDAAIKTIQTGKKNLFKVYMLNTTTNNYLELSNKYKEQVQIGYSKMLPQVALGHSQNAIIATAILENQVLNLSDIMIPPMMSSTMSGSVEKEVATTEENSPGRPALDDSEKSDKTIANNESM